MSLQFDKLVKSFDRLTEMVKVDRNDVDQYMEDQHQRTRDHLNMLRSKRDAAYQQEHDELVRYVREFYNQLQAKEEELNEKERRLEIAFKSACAECFDNMRKALYPAKS